MIRTLEVQLRQTIEDRTYPIFIDADQQSEERFAAELDRRVPNAHVAIVTDETVARLHLARFADALRKRGRKLTAAAVPDGEGSKSLGRAEELCESFAREGLDRKATIIALGGGVVGDLGGFVASIFMRGVPYVQVPTTLLAQVDSSVGGKTGVNLPSGKNLAGTFWQPLFVWADVTALSTLTERDRVAGLAEVVKHAAIADAELLALLEANADQARAGEPDLVAELVERSCALKAKVVGSDERETTGARALLNFGHTVGHAIESASQKQHQPLRHGEAVALGMLAAARVGRALGTSDGLEERLRALLEALGLPTALDERLSPELLARIAVDKKKSADHLAFVIVDAPGQARLVQLSTARVGEILLAKNPR